MKNLLLISIVYLLLMLKLKMVLNQIKIMRRVILLKCKRYTIEDFIARKHGKEREPWVQKPMPFSGKSLKTKEEEHYNKFDEWMRPLFLQIPVTGAIKLAPYSKYMKDIVTNKIKIPN